MDGLFTNGQAAQILGISPQTLRKWRCTGHPQPRYIRLGNGLKARVAYQPADIQLWLAERRFADTTEEAISAQRRRS